MSLYSLQVWTVYKSSCENLESPICLTQGSMECGVKSFLMLKFQSIRSSANVTKLKDKRRSRAHLLLQELSREKYYKHIKKSKEYPSMYTSVIIDNMDQSKTNLPRFPLHLRKMVVLPPTKFIFKLMTTKNKYVIMFLAILVKMEIVKDQADIPHGFGRTKYGKISGIIQLMRTDLPKWVKNGKLNREYELGGSTTIKWRRVDPVP
ncbi:unnamed protein product [Mytilus coruscus]|uniref:Uncharacterized protein n=1 Tax=Mytilus coruscus TaxID=42192 RepID=A0A6J8CAA5_MYTCO|nr:unnamed protein product [Mytilus coruscus]